LLDDLDGQRRDRALIAIESYLVRRMLMGHTTKRYNQFFVDLLPAVAAQPNTADDAILAGLSSSSAVTAVWPSDDELRAHLLSHPLYGWIARSRIEYVLWEVELTLRDSSKTEDIVAKPKKLSIEHILPQQWERTWPLEAPTDENIAHRTGLVNVLGNLTLVTGELDSSMSNSTWATKRQRLEKSILLLNGDVKAVPAWGETAIQERGNSLEEMILRRWPGPGAMVPGFDLAKLRTAIVEVRAEPTDMTDAESRPLSSERQHC
jgi:hypothetical protein